MPYNIGVGATVGNETWWMLGLDFRYAGWGIYSSDLNNDQLANSWRLALGASIVPNSEAKNYLAQIQYKGGVYYGKSEIMNAGKQLSEYGGSVGLTLPIRFSAIYREAARIHLSGDFGTRTPNNSALISENYYRIYFGFTLSNLWFQKRKFD